MRVNKIFESISGEAGLTIPQGSWCTFIRLQGCNLHCDYCDTRHSQSNETRQGKSMSLSDVFQKVKEFGNNNILITGGEPLLQEKELHDLLNVLTLHDYICQVETNGSKIIPSYYYGGKVSWVVDWKTPCAKVPTFDIDGFAESCVNCNSIVKFVIHKETDLMQAIYIMELMRDMKYEGKFIISPINANPDSIDWIIPILHNALIKELLDRVIFSLQLHKILNLP